MEHIHEAGVETRWTEPLLVERCRALRGSLRARGETDAELDALAPGGARNIISDPLGAALRWYALLQGRLSFLEWRDDFERRRAEQALDAALANEPVSVRLSSGENVAVYPKSFHALAWCSALDRSLSRASQRALEHEDVVDTQMMLPLLDSLSTRLWAWILTHDEPDLPFDEGAPADPPAWTRTLSPADLVALFRANFEVNRERIALVATLFPADRQEESRLSLSGFLGTVAHELHARPSDVLRRWSLGEAFAQAVVAAAAAKEARKRAEDEAASRRSA